MAELRWNPLIEDYVMIASHRQSRPVMPKGYCPFCPGSGKVPEIYTVYKYDNDFPALSQNPLDPDEVTGDSKIYKTLPSYGKCEVILFSPEHESSICEFSVEHIREIVDVWNERFIELSKDEKIKYIFIFENRGELVGVTMPHPHGQIYGYSYLPKKIELETNSFSKYNRENNSCMFCDINKDEVDFGQRIIYENESFLVYIPFFCEYPYGVYITSKKHRSNIAELDDKEKTDLALTFKMVTGMYDSIFDKKFPYMMCMHNAPVNSGDVSEVYHFHVEFFPPLRAENTQKFNASSETGVWAHCNPTAPEEKAAEMREALAKFKNKLKI